MINTMKATRHKGNSQRENIVARVATLRLSSRNEPQFENPNLSGNFLINSIGFYPTEKIIFPIGMSFIDLIRTN